MNRQSLLAPYASKKDLRLTLARLLDKQEAAAARAIPAYSGFLSPEEQEEAARLFARLGAKPLFWGGYAAAERRICAFLPDWMEEASLTEPERGPLCALAIATPPQAVNLSHRDYLGALMGLGLTREKFGDILLHEGGAQLLCLREVSSILLDQWDSVGRHRLQLRPLSLSELRPSEQRVEAAELSLAALRADALLAAALNLSRSKAAALITQGKITRNHKPCEKPDATVCVGDVFSCRGFGKFTLHALLGESRKGRLRVLLHRYQ